MGTKDIDLRIIEPEEAFLIEELQALDVQLKAHKKVIEHLNFQIPIYEKRLKEVKNE